MPRNHLSCVPGTQVFMGKDAQHRTYTGVQHSIQMVPAEMLSASLQSFIKRSKESVILLINYLKIAFAFWKKKTPQPCKRITVSLSSACLLFMLVPSKLQDLPKGLRLRAHHVFSQLPWWVSWKSHMQTAIQLQAPGRDESGPRSLM